MGIARRVFSSVALLGVAALTATACSSPQEAANGPQTDTTPYKVGIVPSQTGALASYGPDMIDQYRRVAGYADRILRGAKPADLPVEQSTKFELVINAKIAKVLRLVIPPKLLALADEVIE